jgi:hypothetical protein
VQLPPKGETSIFHFSSNKTKEEGRDHSEAGEKKTVIAGECEPMA